MIRLGEQPKYKALQRCRAAKGFIIFIPSLKQAWLGLEIINHRCKAPMIYLCRQEL